MEKKTMTVLAPDFYNEFSCVAGACRNNCCEYPWLITVDKKDYKQLRSLREPKWFADSFGQYFKRNTNDPSDSNYAHLVKGEHSCVFQTVDKLCRLQAELGASYLCHTCQVYPRLSSYWGGHGQLNKELCLTTSCEEVVRMLLHKPEPIQFVTTTEQYNSASMANAYRTANNLLTVDATRPMLEHYSLVRAICIALLQNRDYTVEQRLMLLVIYLYKLAEAEEAGDTDSVPAMTDSYVQAVDERLYDRVLTVTPIPEVTAVLTNYSTAYALAGSFDLDIANRCDLGFTTVTYEQRTDNYHHFMVDKQAFLEHMLVTELFGKVLPFCEKHSIIDCIQYVVSIYANFRFMLGGYLGEQPTLTEVEFIDFAAFFGKELLHSNNSFNVNLELLKRNNMDTLAYMIAIIKG